jgi:hypothetical protein
MDNQMVNENQGLWFSFILEPDPEYTVSDSEPRLTQTEADVEANIEFTGSFNADKAEFEVVQLQSGKSAVVKVTAVNSGVILSGENFVNDLALDTADIDSISPTKIVEITTVTVTVIGGNKKNPTETDIIFPPPAGQDNLGVTATFNGDGSVTLTGIKAGYVIAYTTEDDHNRVLIENKGDGSGNDSADFDIGGFKVIDNSTSFAEVGSRAVFEDDGPTPVITVTDAEVVHDESPGTQDGNVDAGDPPAPPAGEDDDDDDQDGEPPAASGIPQFETDEGSLTRLGWAISSSAVVTTAGTDFGVDGAAATSDSTVWSLEVGDGLTEDVDSGLTDLSGNKILLNKETVMVGTEEVDLIVGRIDDDGDLSDDVDGSNPVAIVITIDQSGFLSLAQYVAIFHSDITDPDDPVSLVTGSLFAVLTVTDGDGDAASTRADISDKAIIEDDGPGAQGPAPINIEEDDLNNAQAVGIDEDGSVTAGSPDGNRVVTTDFGDVLFVTPGTDADAVFSLSTDSGDLADLATANSGLTSKGGTVLFDVTGNTLTGYVESVDPSGFNPGDRIVFTWVVESDGMATFSLEDSLKHETLNGELGDDTENFLEILLDPILKVTDAEGDPADLGTDFAVYRVMDDIPQLADGTETFTVDEDFLASGIDPRPSRSTRTSWPAASTTTASPATSRVARRWRAASLLACSPRARTRR